MEVPTRSEFLDRRRSAARCAIPPALFWTFLGFIKQRLGLAGDSPWYVDLFILAALFVLLWFVAFFAHVMGPEYDDKGEMSGASAQAWLGASILVLGSVAATIGLVWLVFR
jgi:hypothetical protein